MDKNRFEHRLIAQKLIYLLKLKGVAFCYSFHLYVRGPYSPDLAREYYQHADEFSRCETECTLFSAEADAVAGLTSLFDKSPSLLEIGATYGYLAYELHHPPEQAYRTVRRMKSFYPVDALDDLLPRVERLHPPMKRRRRSKPNCRSGSGPVSGR